MSISFRIFMIKNLLNLRMLVDSPVVNHLNEFNTLWKQLEWLEFVFVDDVKTWMFVCYLPYGQNNVTMASSNASTNAFKFDELMKMRWMRAQFVLVLLCQLLMVARKEQKFKRMLQSKGVLLDIKNYIFDFYQNYLFGKQKRTSFVKTSKEKKTKRLELVRAYI